MVSNSLLRTDKDFAAVYERNIQRVYQICFLYLKSHCDAEDASQAVFEKYLRQCRGFDDSNHERAWFIAVAKNYCRDELKKFWKKKRTDVAQIEEGVSCEDPHGEELAQALLRLPVKCKDAIYLYYIEGYSVREMSGLLRRKESTLRNHLAEGRRLLKIDLGGYYET